MSDETQRNQNAIEKGRLVERARNIPLSGDWSLHHDEMKELMNAWKGLGAAGRDRDHELWADFQEASQRFYEARRRFYEDRAKSDEPERANADQKKRRVIICYSRRDVDLARDITKQLKDQDIEPWFDQWVVESSELVSNDVETAIKSADVIVLLVSKSFLQSDWAARELRSEVFVERFEDRAISVVPVLVEDCQLPASLEVLPYVDLRRKSGEDIRRLAIDLAEIPKIDFASLSTSSFEKLTIDLFLDLGFSFESEKKYDLRALYTDRDPFGMLRTTRWIVEIKHNKTARVDLALIRELHGMIVGTSNINGCVVVCNGKLTSIAREYVGDINRKANSGIRVIEGPELTRLLIQRPELVRQYFSQGWLK